MTKLSFHFLLFAVLSGCKPIEEPKPTKEKALVIVKDISRSNTKDPEIFAAYLKKELGTFLDGNGKQVTIVYAGNTGYDLSTTKVIELEESEQVPESITELEQLRSKDRNARHRTLFIEKVLQATNTPCLDEETHLLETLPHIRQLQPDLEGFDVSVLYCSDMIQDSPIRDFYNNPLSSVAGLDEMAQGDIQALRTKFGFDANLDFIESVKIVTPNCVSSQVQSRVDQGYIFHYWQQVFSSLNVSNVQLEKMCQ